MKSNTGNYRKLWLGIGILILLAPLGLILPEHFRAHGAWGEWGAEDVKGIVGYLPDGLKRISEIWSAPISGYSFPGWDKGAKSYAAYIVSALIGTVIVGVLSYLLGRVLKGDKRE